jgi:diadenosine tetraphosphate (Ap4A) HIT family hydrolase
MPTIFTRVIDGELPGRFVWRDDRCVAFLSINPLQPGHTLVVPLLEVDHWIDLPPAINERMMHVAHLIGRAQQEAFSPARIGLMIAGFEVPHTHLHVLPIRGMGDLDLANAAASVDADEQDQIAATLRSTLLAHGHDEFVPG